MKTKLFTLSALACALIFSGCSKDEDQSILLKTNSPIVLNAKQTATIEASSSQPITYKSKNEFHATVSNSGLVTGRYVGETEIHLSNGRDSKVIKVEVAPKENLYPTPSLEWGTAKSQIIAKYGTPSNESGNIIGYSNYSTAAPIAVFQFEDNKLKLSAVLVKMPYASTLADFLLERYIPIDVDSDKYTAMFLNGLSLKTATTCISLSAYNYSYMMVMYMYIDESISTQSRTSGDDSYLESYRAILDQLLDNF